MNFRSLLWVTIDFEYIRILCPEWWQKAMSGCIFNMLLPRVLTQSDILGTRWKSMELAKLTKKISCTPATNYQTLPTFPGSAQGHFLHKDLEIISENHFPNPGKWEEHRCLCHEADWLTCRPRNGMRSSQRAIRRPSFAPQLPGGPEKVIPRLNLSFHIYIREKIIPGLTLIIENLK